MKQCLVVDDAAVVRKVARRIMEDLSFAVAEAVDGREALEACSRRMPDVMVLDAAMPSMNGDEVLARLRSLPGGEVPVVVYCPVENDAAVIGRAIRAGADAVLLKPFERAHVETALREAGVI